MQSLSPPQAAALLTRTAHGDREAFKELYEGTIQRITRVVRFLVRDEHLLEDVIAETYLQVWQEVANYGPDRGTVVAWITVISRSRALDALRRQGRQAVLAERLHQAGSIRTDPDASEGLESDESAAIIRLHLDNLPVAQQQAIRSTFLEGATHREAAEKLGQPLGTIKTRVRLGLAAIERAMSPEEKPDPPC